MNTRHKQISNQIKKILSRYIHEFTEINQIGFATVTEVEISSDISHCKVWISILQPDREDVIIKKLNQNIKKIQQHLNINMHNKKVPQISFRADHGSQYSQKIDQLLSKN